MQERISRVEEEFCSVSSGSPSSFPRAPSRPRRRRTRTLDALQKKYSGLKDYTVDVNVHFDVEGFKAPDMQAKLYCKPPDRMKIESKRIFFLPKEGGTFNPFMFNKEDFEVKFLERLTYEGRNAVKLKLTPKKRKLNALRISF